MRALDSVSSIRMFVTLMLAGLTLAGTAACTDQTENDNTMADTALADPEGLQPQAGAMQGHGAMQDDTVNVGLVDFELNMPATLPAGPTIFRVTNQGTMAHNFELERDDEEHMFPQDLQPGESRTLEVDLKEGTYQVYCPVGDHESRGMSLELTVEAARMD